LETVQTALGVLSGEVILVASANSTAVLLGLAHLVKLGQGNPVFATERPFPILPGVFLGVGRSFLLFQPGVPVASFIGLHVDIILNLSTVPNQTLDNRPEMPSHSEVW